MNKEVKNKIAAQMIAKKSIQVILEDYSEECIKKEILHILLKSLWKNVFNWKYIYDYALLTLGSRLKINNANAYNSFIEYIFPEKDIDRLTAEKRIQYIVKEILSDG